MKKNTIVFAIAIILVLASCGKGEKVEPTYYSPAEFKGMTSSGKASMHITGPVAGSKNGSKSEGETIECDANNLVSDKTTINSKWEIQYRYNNRTFAKDLYRDSKVIREY